MFNVIYTRTQLVYFHIKEIHAPKRLYPVLLGRTIREFFGLKGVKFRTEACTGMGGGALNLKQFGPKE